MNLSNHALGSSITIAKAFTQTFIILVQENIIHAPGVDSEITRSFAQALRHLQTFDEFGI